MTLLECYAQVLIDLWLADGDLEVDGATYKQHVAAVIKEAKEEAILEIEKRLGCDIQTAVDRLEFFEADRDSQIMELMRLDEEETRKQFEGLCYVIEDEADLVEEWKDKEEMMGFNGQTYLIAREP